MGRALLWGIPIVVVLVAIAYGGVSYLIASGVTKAERKEQKDNPSLHGLQFEDVQFVSRRGDVDLSGWYIPGPSQGPTLIFVHGIDSTRSGDNALGLAARLVARGFSVLMFDLRAHGSSGGEKASGGYQEQYDVLGAFDFLVKRGVQPERIGVLGFSMGAGTSVLALAEEPRIRALAVDSPYANAADLITQETARKTVFPKWMVPAFIPGAKLAARLVFDIDLSALTPERAVKRLDFPILVIHGTDDKRIPVEHGVRVHLAAHRESVLWLAPGVEHVDAFLTYPEDYVNRVAAYFKGRLGGD